MRCPLWTSVTIHHHYHHRHRRPSSSKDLFEKRPDNIIKLQSPQEMDSLVQPAASIQTNRKDDSDINQNLQTPPHNRNLLSEPTDGAVVGSFRRNNNFRNGLDLSLKGGGKM